MGKENSKAIPTQEEYIAELIEAKKQEALNRSRTRTHPRVPMSGTRMSKKEWEQDLNNREDRVREELQKGFITPFLRNLLTNELRTIAIERGMGYDAYRGTGEPLGSSCTATAFDNYGMDIVSSELFRQNHKEHGFKLVDNTNVQPSDIVIDVENGKGSHTLMLDSGTVKENNLRFNASNGGFEPLNLRKSARYPFKGSMESYTYTGTPADSALWINQYKQIYGMAKGGVFGIPKYLGGGTSFQPWRTLQSNHSTELDRWLKKAIKNIANLINKHGNKSSNLLSITLPTTNPDGTSYNPRYSTAPTKTTVSSTGRTNSQEAAALSLASMGLNALGPKGVIAGQILGIPDIVYDWAASIDEPENNRNHFHTVSNHLETIADWTPIPWDDPIAKVIKKSGAIDDAASSFGYDLTDFLFTNKKLKKDE